MILTTDAKLALDHAEAVTVHPILTVLVAKPEPILMVVYVFLNALMENGKITETVQHVTKLVLLAKPVPKKTNVLAAQLEDSY